VLEKVDNMKLKILQQSDKDLKIEVSGIEYSLCNLIQERLFSDTSIDIAGFDRAHPLNPSYLLYLRTKKGKNPANVLLEAIKSSINMNNEFSEKIKKALSK